VKKPLPANPCAEAVCNHAVTVLSDRLKMAKRMRHTVLSLFLLMLPIIAFSHAKVNKNRFVIQKFMESLTEKIF